MTIFLKQKLISSVVIGATLILTQPAWAEEKTFDLEPFNGIDVASGLSVNVTMGDTQSVVATSTDSELDKLSIKVKDGKLIIRRNKKSYGSDLWRKSKSKFSVDVVATELNALSASSSSDITGQDIKTDTLLVTTSSAADIQIESLVANKVKANASSGSDAQINGKCGSLRANASSGADIDFSELACENVNANVSSGADIEVRAYNVFAGNASSGGDIEVYGAPITTEKNTSSGGDITLKDKRKVTSE